MLLPRHVTALLVLVSVLLLPRPTAAQSGNYHNLTKVANARSEFANVLDFTVDGNYVYAADHDLVIWDVSDPSSPQEVKVVTLPDGAGAVAVGSGRAYVAGATLSIVDVSDPPNASLVGSLSIAATAILPIDADYLYVVTNGPFLHVVDVSNPASPQDLSTLAMPSGSIMRNAVREGNLVVLSSGDIVDASSPASPTVVGYLGRYTYGIDIQGSYVYGGLSTGGVDIWDIIDPTAPVLVGHSGLYAERVSVSGDYAYALDSQGFRVLNVSDVTSPRQVGHMGLGGDDFVVIPQEIHAVGGYLYAAFRHGGISILQIAGTPAYTDPATAGLTIFGQYADIAVIGDRAYASIYGLHVLDVSDPANPALLNSLPSVQSGAIAAAGSYICMKSDNGIDVFDIVDPDLPTSRPGYATNNAVGVAIIGDYAYVTQADQGPILVLDMVPPHSPNQGPPLLGSVPFLSDAEFIAAWGERLLVSDGGLRILDASAPNQDAPVQIGYLDVPPFEDARVVGNLAYLSGDAFSIVDLSDPTNPVELSRTDPFTAGTHVAVVGSYAYFVNAIPVYPWDEASATLVIDVSNPEAPFPIGMLSQEVDATGPIGVRSIGSGYLLASYQDKYTGTTFIQALPTQSSGVSAIVSNRGGIQRFLAPPFPNPIRASSRVRYTVTSRGRVTLDLLDVSGRVARRLLDAIEDPGTRDFQWDVRREGLASGVYFLRLGSPDGVEARKVMVLPR